MKLFSSVLLLFLFLALTGYGNNVKIKNVICRTEVVSGNQHKVTFDVTWENSWCDEYNHDAVYVFLKFKKKEASGAQTSANIWRHMYLRDGANKNQINGDQATDHKLWLVPLSLAETTSNYNVGFFLYPSAPGFRAKDSVNVTVNWFFADQRYPAGTTAEKVLTSDDIANNNFLVSVQAIEMVRIPRGAFRVGDGKSDKSFRRRQIPIRAEWDLVNGSSNITSASLNDTDPRLAADHFNDNNNTTASAWCPANDGQTAWWMIDFGEKKTIRYFGVNGSKYSASYYPRTFRLQAREGDSGDWTDIWSGSGNENWVRAVDAYPAARALKIPNPKPFRQYRVIYNVADMNSGKPIVTTIGMTDKNLDSLIDKTFIIDGMTTVCDTVNGLGADDGTAWSGTLTQTFPNGYKAFYAMKYEVSQDQYVRFLNKLTYQQQNALIEGRLDELKEGDYVFGQTTASATNRNGIVLATKIDGMPAVFACNLNAGLSAQEDDGQNVACNFMNLIDMLAYADWSGLRPLTELEFEKMCRQLYPYTPQKGEYAWNSRVLKKGGMLQNAGKEDEQADGNANFANAYPGPVRTGAFATPTTAREQAGASFWGCMELSGNLTEMYYNANNLTGLNLSDAVNNYNSISHGDGYVDVTTGRYNNGGGQWSVVPGWIALRGGSFVDDSSKLAISDRSFFGSILTSETERQSHITFRLGHSVPEPAKLKSVLTLENDQWTDETKIVQDTACDNKFGYYRIRGNEIPGAATYLWYKWEDGGAWNLMEGQNNKDLFFNSFRGDTINRQVYRFRRKVITPLSDSPTPENQYVILTIDPAVVTPRIDTLRVTDLCKPSRDFRATTRENSKFQWEWVEGRKVLTARTGDTKNSYYRPSRDDFNWQSGMQTVRLTVSGGCGIQTFDLKVYVQPIDGPRQENRTITITGDRYVAIDSFKIKTSAASTYKWYTNVANYGDVPLVASVQNDTSSYFCPIRGQFNNNGQATDRAIPVWVVVTQGNCPATRKYSYNLRMEAKNGTVSMKDPNAPCGSMMKDDRGEIYGTVKIGAYCWMAENLRYGTVAEPSWMDAGWYGNVYRAYTANGSLATPVNGLKQGICPEGWNLPTATEWSNLYNAVGSNILKLRSYYTWNKSANQGDNSSGFSALAAGFLWGNGRNNDQAMWWTSNYTTYNCGGVWPVGYFIQFQNNRKDWLTGYGNVCYTNTYNNTGYLANVRCMRK